MERGKTTREVFESWGEDYHANGMETEHWPTVSKIFDLIEPSSGRYLEIGVGNGYGVTHMARHQFAGGECLGLELSASMTRRARERTKALSNVTVENGDFLVWDFGRDRFDTIFSMEVFYYFPDIQVGLDKAFGLLNPGGMLWVAVNFYEENKESADWPDRLDTAMQRWSASDYVDGFERAGFTAVEQRLIEAPPPPGCEHGDAATLCTVGTRPLQ